jgi:hypothetical protein
MSASFRHLGIVLAIFLPSLFQGGCGTINEKLAAGMSDAIPQWAGGLPRDAPPRPGTVEYDEFVKERERKRLEPKEDGARANPPSPAPTH